MKILSIDTSSDVCSVAILEDNNLIKEINKTNIGAQGFGGKVGCGN